MPVNLNTYDFHRVIISIISTALYLQHPKYPNIQLNASIIKHIFLQYTKYNSKTVLCSSSPIIIVRFAYYFYNIL